MQDLCSQFSSKSSIIILKIACTYLFLSLIISNSKHFYVQLALNLVYN